MEEKLRYFMSLLYDVEVRPLSDMDGGGHVACIPQLGRCVVTGCGETEEEAIRCLNVVKEDIFLMWLKAGVEIPTPKKEVQHE